MTAESGRILGPGLHRVNPLPSEIPERYLRALLYSRILKALLAVQQLLITLHRRVGVNAVETFESALLPIALTATMVNV
jgi:hypothetical protein